MSRDISCICVPDVVIQAALAYTETTNLTDALLALLGGVEIKTCENEKCQKRFMFQEGRALGKRHRKDARFCSHICARRTAQRKYRNRKRQAQREQKAQA